MSKASDFKLLDRRAVDVLLCMRERSAFFRALSSWIGFQTAQVEFEVQPRLEGESKWSARSLIRYAITNITSFSSIVIPPWIAYYFVLSYCIYILAHLSVEIFDFDYTHFPYLTAENEICQYKFHFFLFPYYIYYLTSFYIPICQFLYCFHQIHFNLSYIF